MTKLEFISKVYSLLDAGRIEIDGQIYYSEASVIEAMEWMADNAKQIVEVDAQKMIDNMTANIKNIMESFTYHLPKDAKFEVDEKTISLPPGCKINRDENGNIIGVSI